MGHWRCQVHGLNGHCCDRNFTRKVADKTFFYYPDASLLTLVCWASTKLKQDRFQLFSYGCERLPERDIRHLDIGVSPLSVPRLLNPQSVRKEIPFPGVFLLGVTLA